MLGNLPTRVSKRIEIDESGCWLWIGCVAAKTGYGMFYTTNPIAGRLNWMAHRLVYTLLVGDPGQNLHHKSTCPKHCVNPAHLTPLTISQHTSLHGERQVCKKGHVFDEKNTYYRKDNGTKQCRRCKADRQLATYHKDPQKSILYVKIWRERKKQVKMGS